MEMIQNVVEYYRRCAVVLCVVNVLMLDHISALRTIDFLLNFAFGDIVLMLYTVVSVVY